MTGFDDLGLATAVEPELTTVRLPAERWVRRACGTAGRPGGRRARTPRDLPVHLVGSGLHRRSRQRVNGALRAAARRAVLPHRTTRRAPSAGVETCSGGRGRAETVELLGYTTPNSESGVRRVLWIRPPVKDEPAPSSPRRRGELRAQAHAGTCAAAAGCGPGERPRTGPRSAAVPRRCCPGRAPPRRARSPRRGSSRRDALPQELLICRRCRRPRGNRARRRSSRRGEAVDLVALGGGPPRRRPAPPRTASRPALEKMVPSVCA